MTEQEPIDVQQACVLHRDAMYRACLRILRDPHLAEDATHDAIAAAIANPPEVIQKDWASWLCTVARNTAFQYLRRTRTLPLPDDPPRDDREADRRKEFRDLYARAIRFLDEDELADLELYEDVKLTSLTQEDLAKKLGLTVPFVQQRRKKALQTIRDALVAVYLIENPGSCTEPRDLAKAAGKDTPLLREMIMVHARTCTKFCKPKLKERKELFKRLFAAPGLGLASAVLAFIVELVTPKRFAVTATATLAAVTFAVLVDDDRPAPPDLVVVPPSRTEAPSLPVAPPVLPAQPSPEAPPAPPPAPPVQEEPPPPVAPAPVPDDSPPAIADGWVEHRRLVSDNGGRCDDGPRTSDVAAVVRAPDEVRSVTVHLRDDDQDIPAPMYAAYEWGWVGRIGPLEGHDTIGRYDVVIVVVGSDGERVEKKIDELCVSPCGGEAS